MIEARCAPASDTLTIPQIIAETERIWMEELRCPHFEAHVVGRTGYDVSLDFLTLSDHGGLYLTGSLVVDSSKIQGPVRVVTFWYRLAGHGWSEAGIFDGVSRAFLTASYLSDALGDLTSAVIALLQGTQQSTCSWQEEPGEYRWVFDREGEHLRIQILQFADTFPHEPDERGTPVFATECELPQFAGQLRDQLRCLLGTYGMEEYKQNWVSDEFPLSEYRKLEELLVRLEDHR